MESAQDEILALACLLVVHLLPVEGGEQKLVVNRAAVVHGIIRGLRSKRRDAKMEASYLFTRLIQEGIDSKNDAVVAEAGLGALILEQLFGDDDEVVRISTNTIATCAEDLEKLPWLLPEIVAFDAKRPLLEHLKGLVRSTSQPEGFETMAFNVQGRARDALRILGAHLAGGGKGRGSEEAESATQFAAGSRVIVHGLKSRPELNGKKGYIKTFTTSSERYAVDLPLGSAMTKVAVKAANLELTFVSNLLSLPAISLLSCSLFPRSALRCDITHRVLLARRAHRGRRCMTWPGTAPTPIPLH
jgi:hypothetical protein